MPEALSSIPCIEKKGKKEKLEVCFQERGI
jgi:hypothetical protein